MKAVDMPCLPMYRIFRCVFEKINRISQSPQDVEEAELDKLLGIAVDVENLFMCADKEQDSDTKQVYKILL